MATQFCKFQEILFRNIVVIDYFFSVLYLFIFSFNFFIFEEIIRTLKEKRYRELSFILLKYTSFQC
jgi:hypothetical protein